MFNDVVKIFTDDSHFLVCVCVEFVDDVELNISTESMYKSVAVYIYLSIW